MGRPTREAAGGLSPSRWGGSSMSSIAGSQSWIEVSARRLRAGGGSRPYHRVRMSSSLVPVAARRHECGRVRRGSRSSWHRCSKQVTTRWKSLFARPGAADQSRTLRAMSFGAGAVSPEVMSLCLLFECG